MEETKMTDVEIVPWSLKRLKEEAAKSFLLPIEEIDMVICGKVVTDEDDFQACETTETVIHVLRNTSNVPPNKESTDTISPVLVLKTLLSKVKYKKALKKFLTPETVRNIVVATPGLLNDEIALGFVGDPELLYHFCNSESVMQICQRHPSLVEACDYIVVTLKRKFPDLQGTSFMLDEEALDATEMLLPPLYDRLDGADQQTTPLITQSQLASALAAVEAGLTEHWPSEVPPETLPTAISSDMVRLAVEQSLSQNSSLPELANITMPQDALNTEQQRQIQQMRELGFLNDAMNLQALEMTNGDVQNAIDLICHLLCEDIQN